MYFKRTITTRISDLLTKFPVVVLTGPRQTGKSTEAWQFTKKGFAYVSLDDLQERELALHDPKYFLQIHSYPLIIDEIQYAPVLMEAIEEIVNRKRLEEGSANGLFILTGSQTFSLMKGVSQSMAGRAAVLEMNCLSSREIQGEEEIPFIPDLEHYHTSFDVTKTSEDLFKKITRGFYPELYNNPALSSQEFYENYIRTYIERDVADLIDPSNKLEFRRFMQLLANMISSPLNYASIATAIGVSSNTIKSWVSILETSGIIFLLQPYSEKKLSKRVVKAPKIYFCDTGLAAHLARVYSASNLEISLLAGPYMENYCICEIRKSYNNNGLNPGLYYYRDSNQNEVDLIIESELKLHLIEIKKGVSFNKGHVKGFQQLSKSALQIGPSCILCNTQKNYALEKDLFVLSCLCI